MDGPNSSSRQYVRRRRDWRHVKNRKLWCDFTFFCLSFIIIHNLISNINYLEKIIYFSLSILELVSKELNHFGGIVLVSPILGTGDTDRWHINLCLCTTCQCLRCPISEKPTRSPQSDLTHWIGY